MRTPRLLVRYCCSALGVVWWAALLQYCLQQPLAMPSAVRTLTHCFLACTAVLAAFAAWANANMPAGSLSEEAHQCIAAICSRIRFPELPPDVVLNYWACFGWLQQFDGTRELPLRAVSAGCVLHVHFSEQLEVSELRYAAALFKVAAAMPKATSLPLPATCSSQQPPTRRSRRCGSSRQSKRMNCCHSPRQRWRRTTPAACGGRSASLRWFRTQTLQRSSSR